MRIACIHIPQFALQSATRIDPALRGAAVAVVSGVEPGRETAGVLHAPIVLACSRLAWAQGVRLGMTATAARSQSSQVCLVTAHATNERETVRAIADALLGVSSVVDIGGRVGAGGAHLAMYAEVPAKTRGAAFGERLLEVIDELGLAARIGIADDRFTAWVAAAHGGVDERARVATHGGVDERGRVTMQGGVDERGRVAEPSGPAWIDRSVIAVPRGGSAAFLAPRPLSLLAISPEVQHMLEALGVRTLGEFAALPAPSIARPLDADYRALARGESDATLRPYAPEAPIREEVTVSGGNVLELQDLLPAGTRAGGLSFAAAVALVSRRIALRLVGRGRGAARLDVIAVGKDGERELPITLAAGAADADELGHVLTPALEPIAAEHGAAHDEWRLRVTVAAEMILDGETTEIFAEGSAPYVGHLHVERAAQAGDRHPDRHISDHPQADAPAAPIDPLSVVLSSSGALFALSAPALRAERRDAHRRTRRGKLRRTRPTPHAQPRLFDRVSSKT
jgi:hypothetical protein